MWDNMNLEPLKLEDITTEKLLEIEKHAQEVRLKDVTLSAMNEVAKQRENAQKDLLLAEMECQRRAIRARTLGFSKAELGRIFDVSQSTINRWVG